MVAQPAVAQVAPACPDRLDDLSVAQLAVKVLPHLPPPRRRSSAPGRCLTRWLTDGQARQDGGKYQGEHAQRGVQQEKHQQVNGGLQGASKKANMPLPVMKLADVGEIGESLYRVIPALIEMRFEAGIEHPAVQLLVQAHAKANQETRTRPFGEGDHGEEKQDVISRDDDRGSVRCHGS
jgi:hypothetical protein